MNENNLIKNYLAKLVKKNPAALNLNDDVFFDKNNKTSSFKFNAAGFFLTNFAK